MRWAGCWQWVAGTGNSAEAGAGAGVDSGSLWLAGSEAWRCMGLMVARKGSSREVGPGMAEIAEVAQRWAS